MQYLLSNLSNTIWRNSLFESIQEEEIDLKSAHNVNKSNDDNVNIVDINRYGPVQIHLILHL